MALLKEQQDIDKLVDASADGKRDEVDTLLGKGVDVNGKYSWRSRSTALHKAAEWGHEDIARILIDNGAEVNAGNACKGTPLHVAAGNGRKDVAGILIGSGAEVNAGDDDKYTPLHLAAANGHKDIAGILVDSGAEVNAEDERKSTPLHEAAEWGHKDVAHLLVLAGADTTARDKQGRTPVDFAPHSTAEAIHAAEQEVMKTKVGGNVLSMLLMCYSAMQCAVV